MSKSASRKRGKLALVVVSLALAVPGLTATGAMARPAKHTAG
jgi:hypothetical protein